MQDYLLLTPALKLAHCPHLLTAYVDHSHCPALAPATLAALPSTRAIPDRDVFYVAHPIRSIRGPALYEGDGQTEKKVTS